MQLRLALAVVLPAVLALRSVAASVTLEGLEIESFEGRIVGIGAGISPDGEGPVVVVTLDVPEIEGPLPAIPVYLAPRPFLASHGIRFEIGDDVEVTGVDVGTEEGMEIIATTIAVGKRSLALRLPNGQALWNLLRQMPQSH